MILFSEKYQIFMKIEKGEGYFKPIEVFKFGQRKKIYKEVWTVSLIPKGT